jgi:carbonic anhydrase/acetyltransferase-like protein (isoleucine patch superfamily)
MMIKKLIGCGLWSGLVFAASFVDPTARRLVVNPANVHLGDHVYVGPFAVLKAGTTGSFGVHIGAESNVQDNVTVDGSLHPVHLGDMVILAHGASVKGGTLGETGICPVNPATGVAPAHCPSFVGFNSLVEGTVEKDAMVLHLARVGPGVTIPSGRAVKSGKNVTTQAQATDPAFTVLIGAGERAFMHGVIEVNLAFAAGYPLMEAADPNSVKGINRAPVTAFNPGHAPTINGVETILPTFRNRIIGSVDLHVRRGSDEDDEETTPAAKLNARMGARVSIRADEGEPFHVGTIGQMGNSTVFHALEHSHIHTGNNGIYGAGSLVHGGNTPFAAPYTNTTVTGDNVEIRAGAVFFRSRIGNNSRVGVRSLVQDSDLPAGTIIGDRKIVVGGVIQNNVEW